MITSGIGITGKLSIQLFDESGRLKSETNINNTVTAVGKQFVADQLSRVPASLPMNYMAIGTSTPSTTALGSESSRVYIYSITDSGAVVTFTGKWDIDKRVSGSITEAGIFNKSTLGGTMLCSASFSAISKGINDSLVITWTLTIK